MRGGHHALPIDLDDAVADAHTAPLRDAPTHEAADLSDMGLGWGVPAVKCPCPDYQPPPARKGGEN